MDTTTAVKKKPPTPRRGTAAQGPWLNGTDSAGYLGVGRTKFYEHVKAGNIPPYELEGMRGPRYRIADLDRLLRRARRA